MFLDRVVGPLSDLDGRNWDAPTVLSLVRRRIEAYSELGLTRSDRVFLHHGNTLEFFVDLLAVWELGGCAVPVDSRLTPFEVEVLAGAAKPRFSVWKGEPEASLATSLSRLGVTLLAGWDEPSKQTGSQFKKVGLFLDDEALILFTSGTTGQPKGVVHTHRSLRARWMSLRQSLGQQSLGQQSLGLDSYRRTLCLLPTHFGHGLICNCLFPWLSGQHLFVGAPSRPDLVMSLGTLLDHHAITFMSSVPSLWRFALKTAKPPESRTLKRVLRVGATLRGSLEGSPEMDWDPGRLQRLRHHRNRKLAGWNYDPQLHPRRWTDWRGLGWRHQCSEKQEHRDSAGIRRAVCAGRIRLRLGQHTGTDEGLPGTRRPDPGSGQPGMVCHRRYRLHG